MKIAKKAACTTYNPVLKKGLGPFLLAVLCLVGGRVPAFAQPRPQIVLLNPDSTPAGTSALSIEVIGNDFVPTSIFQWNGIDRSTNVLNSQRLSANILAAELAVAGTAVITVKNPGPLISNAVAFTITPPLPAITSISPSSIQLGSANFTLTVTGSGFSTNSVVRWNDSDRTTVYGGPSTLFATILAADVANAGTATVRVYTPLAGTSNPAQFTITTPQVVTSRHYFPHFALGGGYDTMLSLMNTGSGTLTGTISFYSQFGQPLQVSYTEPSVGQQSGYVWREAVGSSLPLTLIQAGSTTIQLQHPTGSSTPTVGWIAIETTGGTLDGVATFRYRLGGVLKSVASVLKSQAVSVVTFPFSTSVADKTYMGFAVANPNAEPIYLKMTVVTQGGQLFESGLTFPDLFPLPAGSQVARFLHQYRDYLANTKGTIILQSFGGKTFAIVALQETDGIISAVPVTIGKAPNIPD